MSDYVIQSVIFKQRKYSLAEAKKWLTGHNYSSRGVDKTANMLRFRQMTPKKVEKMGFTEYVTKPLGSSGISLIIAYKKKIDGGGIFSDIWKRVKGQHRVAPEPPTAEVGEVPSEPIADVFMVDTSPPSAENLAFNIPRAEQVTPDRSRAQRAQVPEDKRHKFYKPIIDAHMKNLVKREKYLNGRIKKLQAKLAQNMGFEDAFGIEFPRAEIKVEIGILREALADIDWRVGSLERYTFLLDENNAPQDNPQARDEFYLERDEMFPLESTYTNVANTLAQRVRDWVNRTPSINPESAFLIGAPSDAARAPPPPPPSGSGITGGALSDAMKTSYKQQYNELMERIALLKVRFGGNASLGAARLMSGLEAQSRYLIDTYKQIMDSSEEDTDRDTINYLDNLFQTVNYQLVDFENSAIGNNRNIKKKHEERGQNEKKKQSEGAKYTGNISTTAGLKNKKKQTRDAKIKDALTKMARIAEAPPKDLFAIAGDPDVVKFLSGDEPVNATKKATRRPKDSVDRYASGRRKPIKETYDKYNKEKRVKPSKETVSMYKKTRREKEKLLKKDKVLKAPLPPLPPVDENTDLFAGEYDPDVEQYLEYDDADQFDEQGDLDQMDFDLPDVDLDEGMTLEEAIAEGATLPPSAFIPRRSRPPGMRQMGKRRGRGIYLKGHSRISGGVVPVSRSSSPLPAEEPDAPGFPRPLEPQQNQMINNFVQQKAVDLRAQDTPDNRRLHNKLIQEVRIINRMPANRQTYELGQLILEYLEDVWGDVPHFSPANYVPPDVGVWRNGALAPYIRTHRSNVVQGDGVSH